jgi:hypothetical protein
MKLRCIIWFGVVLLSILRNATGQDFQNLDFESANLSPIPSGQFGGFVPIANALPGWTGYIGSIQVTTVGQNDETLGDASIDILGPDWSYGGIIEGQYTVVLQPGFDPFGSGQNVSVSIAQFGLVPANALSLEFKAQTSSSFSVSLGGQDLSLIPLGTGSNYTLYGADISPFAGQVETLGITALAAPNTTDYFDSFVFSPSSVPEPSALSLLNICFLFLCWRLKRPNTARGRVKSLAE